MPYVTKGRDDSLWKTFPLTLRMFSSHSLSLDVVFGVDFRQKHGIH